MRFFPARLLNFFIFFAITCCLTVQTQAGTYKALLTSDAFLSYSTSPTDNTVRNYGGAGAVAVSASSASLTKGEFQSVLRFNAGDVKTYYDGFYGVGNWTIDS